MPKGDRLRLVVSLSTIPSRIHLLEPTLKSLIDKQTRKPDLLYLVLPKKRKPDMLLNYTIPPFIERYQRRGKLKILTPEWDYGSISKILPTLVQEPSDASIVYLDDDVLYDQTLLQTLMSKSLQYPGCAICLSGVLLRNHFRQVGHTELHKNQHPYLFCQTTGTLLFGEAAVDIAQGFMGVLVQPSYFDVRKLQRLVERVDLPDGVRKSDDFIVSAHLETQNITRMLVEGTPSRVRQDAASIDKLSVYMYMHAMEAACFLQRELGIWADHKFVNPALLSEPERNAIHCEAGRGHCFDEWQNVLKEMEKKYPP